MGRLNGWHRIFVIFSIVWVIPTYYYWRPLAKTYTYSFVAQQLEENDKKLVDFSKLSPEQRIVANEISTAARKYKVDPDSALIFAFKVNQFKEVPVLPFKNDEELPTLAQILWGRASQYSEIQNGVKNFTTPDGETLSFSYANQTQDEIAVAYQQVLPKIKNHKRQALIEFLMINGRNYFLPLLVLYLSGFAISWIRKGFQKN